VERRLIELLAPLGKKPAPTGPHAAMITVGTICASGCARRSTGIDQRLERFQAGLLLQAEAHHRTLNSPATHLQRAHLPLCLDPPPDGLAWEMA